MLSLKILLLYNLYYVFFFFIATIFQLGAKYFSNYLFRSLNTNWKWKLFIFRMLKMLNFFNTLKRISAGNSLGSLKCFQLTAPHAYATAFFFFLVHDSLCTLLLRRELRKRSFTFYFCNFISSFFVYTFLSNFNTLTIIFLNSKLRL